MFDLLGVLAKCVLIIAGAAVIFAFITFSPMLFCHGGGAGGNCGEGLLASLPLALFLTPVILIFGTIYFFRSTKKVLLSVLAVAAAAITVSTIASHIWAAGARSYMRSHPTKVMQDHAVFSYKYCLEINAKRRARISEDQPSAIEHLSLDKCAKERQALFDDFQINPGAVATLEQEFQINLPLLISSQKRRG
jgi:hypothetical protein